ncbi:MAG TPA: methyltransferase domain-containing protein [Candidatus Caccovicinus merdipullorum]|uniref:Methyltransferase domain-containing protein n=1 Tax=Candidatus Caccovicinus merdipullorum TaxID=2840724 RepID=A0A9D1KHP8_9FIRM|nr:methyltransferase domain-containing protein [Candidatus Caccovicinus merdipullorum]
MDPIDYYNKYAAKVFEDTVDQNMDAITAPFLELLEEGDTILDMGCGSGRDSLTFYDLGYDVTPLDGSEEMCRLAEVHTGLDVLQMTYEEMAFDGAFDGVWACGAFVHIPKDEMPALFRKVARALTEDGIFYLSMRLGDFEGFQGERYFSCYSEKELRSLVEGDGLFTVLKEWVTRDVRSGHSDIQWINILARKK